jgi:hypothetical protein
MSASSPSAYPAASAPHIFARTNLVRVLRKWISVMKTRVLHNLCEIRRVPRRHFRRGRSKKQIVGTSPHILGCSKESSQRSQIPCVQALAEQERQKNQRRRIGVDNRDYHSLSHFEIDGAKRISQHLSNLTTLATLLVRTIVRNNCQLGIVFTCKETATA